MGMRSGMTWNEVNGNESSGGHPSSLPAHTWAIDVHVNGLSVVFRLQEEELGHHQAGVLISDLLHTSTEYY